MSPGYKLVLSTAFVKKRRRLTKKDKNLDRAIISTLTELENDPYRKTLRLVSYQRERRIHVSSKWRLNFIICEECRELGEDEHNKCHDCDNRGPNTVVISSLMPRKRGYRKLW